MTDENETRREGDQPAPGDEARPEATGEPAAPAVEAEPAATEEGSGEAAPEEEPTAPSDEEVRERVGAMLQQGRFAEAEDLLRDALAVAEQRFGREDPAVCPSLANLAMVLSMRRKGEEGETLAERALALARRHHGPEHEETAQILAMLAQIQSGIGKRELATANAKEALRIFEASLGLNHPLLAEARPALQPIIEGKDTKPPSAASVAAMHAQIQQAVAAAQGGEMDQAVQLFKSVIEDAARDGLPGPEATARGLLAQAMALMGNDDEARAHARRAVEIADELGDEESASEFRQLLEQIDSPTGILAAQSKDELLQRVYTAAARAEAGDPLGACDELEAVADDAKRAEHHLAEASARGTLSMILVGLRQPERAVAHARRAVTVAELVGQQEIVTFCREALRSAERAGTRPN